MFKYSFPCSGNVIVFFNHDGLVDTILGNGCQGNYTTTAERFYQSFLRIDREPLSNCWYKPRLSASITERASLGY